MLTLEEIRKVNDLLSKKRSIEHVLSSFNSPFVSASMGLVAINGSDKWNPLIHDDAKFTNCHLADIISEVNVKFLNLVNAELKHINAELSKYLKDIH